MLTATHNTGGTPFRRKPPTATSSIHGTRTNSLNSPSPALVSESHQSTHFHNLSSNDDIQNKSSDSTYLFLHFVMVSGEIFFRSSLTSTRTLRGYQTHLAADNISGPLERDLASPRPCISGPIRKTSLPKIGSKNLFTEDRITRFGLSRILSEAQILLRTSVL